MAVELLQIEHELSGPDAQAAMERYDQQLVALSSRAQAALDAGLPPEEHGRCRAIPEVVTIARKLLRLQLRDNESPLP